MTAPSERPVPVALRSRLGRVEREPLRALVRHILDREGAPSVQGIGLILAGTRLVRRLNREWRGLDRPTDVLSFSFGDSMPLPADAGETDAHLLGEIIICLPRCLVQAEERGMDPGVELVRLVVHGSLHLLRYDHEIPGDRARMQPKERSLRSWAAQRRIGPGLLRITARAS
jgi:probable rRNA maturation factor